MNLLDSSEGSNTVAIKIVSGW